MTNNTSILLKIFDNFRICGLKSIVEHDENTTEFLFKGGMNKRISRLKVSYDYGNDLWNLTFGKFFKYEYKKVEEFNGIYTEDMRGIFEKTTGYYIKLF